MNNLSSPSPPKSEKPTRLKLGGRNGSHITQDDDGEDHSGKQLKSMVTCDISEPTSPHNRCEAVKNAFDDPPCHSVDTSNKADGVASNPAVVGESDQSKSVTLSTVNSDPPTTDGNNTQITSNESSIQKPDAVENAREEARDIESPVHPSVDTSTESPDSTTVATDKNSPWKSSVTQPALSLVGIQQAKPEDKELYEACESGNVKAVRKVLKKNPCIEGYRDHSTFRSALHVASENGFDEVVYTLLEHRPRPDIDFVLTPTKETSLFLAAKHGHYDTARALLKYRCNVNAENRYGNVALCEAISSGHGEIVRLLVEYEADVNRPNQLGITPLHFLCYQEELSHDTAVSIAAMLLAAGANVHARDHLGYTPLLVCCITGRKEIIDLLLAYDADLAALSNDGKDMHALATEYKHADIAKRFPSRLGN